MALDASQVLGSPQLAAVKVNHRGMATRNNAIGGAIAGAAAAIMQDHPGSSGPDQTPRFGRLALLAVTDGEFALVGLKSTLTLKVDKVLVRVPRSEVKSIELGRGVPTPLTVLFGHGGTWRLEVPPPNKKHAEEVIRALGV
jgi:hypothetical protein